MGKQTKKSRLRPKLWGVKNTPMTFFAGLLCNRGFRPEDSSYAACRYLIKVEVSLPLSTPQAAFDSSMQQVGSLQQGWDLEG